MLTFSKMTDEQISGGDFASQSLSDCAGQPDFRKLQADASLFAAWLDGECIGIAALSKRLSELQPTSGIVTLLAVLPKYRRQGVGRMLMGLLAGAAMEQGAYFLRGSIPASPEATAFAAKIGFRAEAGDTGFLLLDLTDTSGLRQH